MDFLFFLNSALMGVGLAMDAFSVSVANSLNEPEMSAGKMCGIAGVFAAFQAFMPLTGWTCVHLVIQHFTAFQKYVPWIALLLLGYIGGKMIIDALRRKSDDAQIPAVGFGVLMMQGVATSIDALSVGFTIAEYGFLPALACALVISAVTFAVCMGGLLLGKRFGMLLSDKASVVGGVILIGIGVGIFLGNII